MDQIPDIILAIEDYLAKSGKGNSYLVDKISEVFESENSVLNVNGTFMEELRQSFLDMKSSTNRLKNKINNLTTSIGKFTNNIKQIQFPDFSNFQFPDFSSLAESFDNFQVVVTNLEKKYQTLSQTTKEKAVGDQTVLDINIKSVSRGVIEKLVNQLVQKNRPISYQDNRMFGNTEREEKSGMLGSIFKFAVGTLALFAGIGYISKFFNTPHGQKIKTMISEKFNKLWNFMKPYWDNIYNSVSDAVSVGFTKVKEGFMKFFKNAFNFFNLKELLPGGLEGLAVPITKGIVKISGILTNIFSFGLFGKLTGAIETFGKFIFSIGDNVTKFLTKITTNSGTIGKLAAGAGKLFTGGLLKGLGKGLMKRIPIIGSFFNFKDAYDRFKTGDYTGGFISVASGLANFIPGAGTVISIGLDMLNAFIDYKSSTTGQSKMNMILGFLAGIRDKVWDGLKNMLGSMLEMLNPANWSFGDPNDKRSIWEKIKSGTASLFSSEPAKPQVPENSAPPVNKIVKSASAEGFKYDNFKAPEMEGQEIFLDTKKELEKLNKKMEDFSNALMNGMSLLSETSMRGSATITEAIIATSGNKGGSAPNTTVIQSGADPIQQYRIRAQRAIEYQGR